MNNDDHHLLVTVSIPIPIPTRKATGALRVRVRVGVKIPMGYPCRTLISVNDINHAHHRHRTLL